MCWSHAAWGFESSHFRIANHFPVSRVESATISALLKPVTSDFLESGVERATDRDGARTASLTEWFQEKSTRRASSPPGECLYTRAEPHV